MSSYAIRHALEVLGDAGYDEDIRAAALAEVDDLEEEIARLRIAAGIALEPDGLPPGYIIPEGDARCDFTMDACKCMKRKGHDGLHACAHGGWR